MAADFGAHKHAIAGRFPGLGIATVAFTCYVLYDNLTSKETLEKAKHEADTKHLVQAGLFQTTSGDQEKH